MATAYRPTPAAHTPMGDLFEMPHAPVAPPPSPVFDTDDDEEAAALRAQLNAAIDADEDAAAFADDGMDAGQCRSVYSEITDLLVDKGIPRAEIAWIHDAKTPGDREALFAKMRKGTVRVLLGSTFRMGVGVNVQERCYAVHHLTTPWRPCDVKQADGRIWRPGNLFPEVWIFRYIAAPSFDGFSWQGIETKGRFEDAYLRGDPTVRVMQDIDEQIISAGEIKALASGDPRIVQKVRLEHELDKLQQQRRGWEGTRRNERYKLMQVDGEAEVLSRHAAKLRAYQARLAEGEMLQLLDQTYDLAEPGKQGAHGKAIRDALISWGTTLSMTELKRTGWIEAPVGTYRSLPLVAHIGLDRDGKVKLPIMFLASDDGARLTEATVYIGDRATIADRLEQAADGLDATIATVEAQASQQRQSAARIRASIETPWEHERAYRMMELGLRYLNAALNEDTSKTEAVITEILALAASEGLDIEGIIAEGQAIEERGVDLSQIRVQLPPLPTGSPVADAAPAAETRELAPSADETLELAPSADEPPRPIAPPAAPAAQGSYVSLSIFANPLEIARPTLEVATLDLKDMATEAARKKAELANKKRRQARDAGQVSFLDV